MRLHALHKHGPSLVFRHTRDVGHDVDISLLHSRVVDIGSEVLNPKLGAESFLKIMPLH